MRSSPGAEIYGNGKRSLGPACVADSVLSRQTGQQIAANVRGKTRDRHFLDTSVPSS
jgi:hypothetical protein